MTRKILYIVAAAWVLAFIWQTYAHAAGDLNCPPGTQQVGRAPEAPYCQTTAEQRLIFARVVVNFTDNCDNQLSQQWLSDQIIMETRKLWAEASTKDRDGVDAHMAQGFAYVLRTMGNRDRCPIYKGEITGRNSLFKLLPDSWKFRLTDGTIP